MKCKWRSTSARVVPRIFFGGGGGGGGGGCGGSTIKLLTLGVHAHEGYSTLSVTVSSLLFKFICM